MLSHPLPLHHISVLGRVPVVPLELPLQLPSGDTELICVK